MRSQALENERWHLTDAVSKYQAWEAAIGRKDLAARLFSAGLKLAEQRCGGMFAVREDPLRALEFVSERDLLETERRERAGAKNQLQYLLRKTSATELSPAVLESIAQIDGSVVLDRDAKLLAFGAILRHRPQVDQLKLFRTAPRGRAGRGAGCGAGAPPYRLASSSAI